MFLASWFRMSERAIEPACRHLIAAFEQDLHQVVFRPWVGQAPLLDRSAYQTLVEPRNDPNSPANVTLGPRVEGGVRQEREQAPGMERGGLDETESGEIG